MNTTQSIDIGSDACKGQYLISNINRNQDYVGILLSHQLYVVLLKMKEYMTTSTSTAPTMAMPR